MLKRLIQTQLKQLLQQFPAAALVGPRQAGKTTLAKAFSDQYFDLEQEKDRLIIDLKWDEIIASKQLIIFDEAQVWPDLFPRLRGAIDADRKRNGRFLLLGSIAPALMKEVSESLAGRLGLCELTPFLVFELPKTRSEQHWFMGGYPDGGIRSSAKGIFPLWQKNYLNLLAQRDLPLWGLPAKPQVTQRLFKMLAHHHGQIWNASAIGKSLDLNYHTINSYLDYLQNCFLIRLLPSYHRNLKKRLVKSPKIYWRDSGLLHALMDVKNGQDLVDFPWIGFSWEGWVIEQILSWLNAKGIDFQASYLRTSNGEEIDLVLEISGKRLAFEIKLSRHPDARDLQRLQEIAGWIKADYCLLISRDPNSMSSQTSFSGSVSALPQWFKRMNLV